ncbi:secreted protein [Streptomyces viridochromogenes DSM 40736]|uniref:Secreted protein n=1 Tax=Streptomyces viridochromogenes (strain DSM 40736 / JCM 4977 / BCRC 1201 / Tue 494) TaxID=591159 RepID=D9X2I7_STRVT|nr:HNH endonuclease family protein [Streptomyces viridochromogenes]EFL33656.1 secreted protein [Streptomyces viridochromogenes DSM 40736]
MIKNLRRAALAAALVALPLLAPTPAQAHGRAAEPSTLPLATAVGVLPLAEEVRDGYQRTSFRHWNAGQNPTDGCNTRAEVLISEAVDPPEVLAGCRLSGGRWWSYYDARWVTEASALDVDHMVPLAEAWDSGASQWTAPRREAYANDLDAQTSLIAVTAASNRSKADKDPAEWLPPAPGVTCRYTSEWVATKLRWGLAADDVEFEALTRLAQSCPDTTVTFDPAP